MKTTRRDTLRLAAIAAAAAAAQTPLTSAHAERLPGDVELTAALPSTTARLVRGTDSFIAVKRRLDWLVQYGDECCCQDLQADYKAVLHDVIALDPERFAGISPLSDLDEAVFAWATALWVEGVRHGAAAATGLLLVPGVDFTPPHDYQGRPYVIDADNTAR